MGEDNGGGEKSICFPLTLSLSLQGRGNYKDVISFDRLRTGIHVHRTRYFDIFS